MKKTLFVIMMLAPCLLFADQQDPRLEDLFSSLKQETDVYLANSIANTIWDIWLEHDDSQASSLMRRGIQQMNANSLYAALDTYDQLVSLKPDFAEAWNKRATIYWLLGEFDASLRDIEEVLKLEPFHFGALSGRGLVYMDRGDYVLARSAFLTLLEVYPAMPGVRENVDMLERILQDRAI